MIKKHQKRFIAGAVCPGCQQSDTTTMDGSLRPTVRECVSCGFKEVHGAAKKTSQPAEQVVRWVKNANEKVQ
jgi:uncharacterized protein